MIPQSPIFYPPLSNPSYSLIITENQKLKLSNPTHPLMIISTGRVDRGQSEKENVSNQIEDQYKTPNRSVLER